jgi:hypothetical protein
MATKLFPNLDKEGQAWPAESYVDEAVELFKSFGTIGVPSLLARAAERISREPDHYQHHGGDWLRTKAIYEAVRDEHGSFLDSETSESQMLIKARALELLRRAKAVVDGGAKEDFDQLSELVGVLYPLYDRREQHSR